MVKTATKPVAKSTAKQAKAQPVAPVKPDAQTVTAHLICAGAAKAIEFYIRAFKAEELMRLAADDGSIMHACVRIGNSPVFLVDENIGYGMAGPKALKGSPVTLHLTVADADGFVAHAAKAGAKVTMPVAEMFWGDRYGQIEDPFGHRWSVASKVREMTLAEIKAAAKVQGG